jgi:hypothetical protein
LEIKDKKIKNRIIIIMVINNNSNFNRIGEKEFLQIFMNKEEEIIIWEIKIIIIKMKEMNFIRMETRMNLIQEKEFLQTINNYWEIRIMDIMMKPMKIMKIMKIMKMKIVFKI